LELPLSSGVGHGGFMKFLALAIVLLSWSGIAFASEDQAALNLAKAQQAVRCSAMLHVTGESLPSDDQRQNTLNARLLLLAATGWGADPEKFEDWGNEVIALAADKSSEDQWNEERRICNGFIAQNIAEIGRVAMEVLAKDKQ
jgi:hypothetical protein